MVAISDVNGTVIESYEYDIFGEPTIWDVRDPTEPNDVESSVVGNPYLFTGRAFDEETGLYYYRFRYYAPEIGRFLQTDPIRYYYSMNLYEYCWNNPINWIDPWGEDIMRTGYPLRHQRIEIGNTKRRRNNEAWSLAPRGYSHIIPVFPGTGYGTVYYDTSAGEGWILDSIHTTLEQDEYAKKILREMEIRSYDDPYHYPYFFGPYDCRWFSDLMFEMFKNMFRKIKKGSN